MEVDPEIGDVPCNDFEPLMIDKGCNTSSNSFNLMDYRSSSQLESESSITVAYLLKTAFFIFVWYTVSTLLTLYNKTLLGDHMGRFPAPLLMNTIHFAIQATLSMAITRFWPDKHHSPVMSWRDYLSKVVPTAVSTALDIDLSNASLVFISVTFATMCKSASPIFLLLFAFAFRLESPSVELLGIILIISMGVLLTAAKETEFEFWGFLLVMLSAFMSGLRWTMTQILLQKEVYGLKNPLTLMSYVAPVMMVATAVLSLLLDPWDEFNMSNYFNSWWHTVRSCLLMSFGGILAFVMVLSEYILVSVTSAVTVTIAGVVKEVVTILVAVLYFHDEFTWIKGVGLAITMVGVSLFNWYKLKQSCKSVLLLN
ncbi:probable sugar phosphate/phosphate translocator At1g06470 isoform X2 [Andrographis paniculata]|uniref:probable sugar phosphate/phosphate translocator At1g06470 isoform X2 n=1 Tax=Andrographis paniculata TaxID=175694 RepID=UPI0021E9568E|nr:probable sugar phosphate/phosphate translocator At1g06470 isoform X2 [Andrographis paniculata]